MNVEVNMEEMIYQHVHNVLFQIANIVQWILLAYAINAQKVI